MADELLSINFLEKKARETGTERAVGQITDGSGELRKNQNMQGPESQVSLVLQERREPLEGLKKGGNVITFQFG